MDLKGLIYRELGEGLTEKELASAVGVSVGTIANILANKHPRDPRTWAKFAKYFRMDADFLQTGDSTQPNAVVGLSASPHHSAAGHIRSVPLLDWDHIEAMATSKEPHRAIRAEAMIETTDVPGTRTFALKVKDNSMQPLFSEGEMIFVNPDVTSKPGDYVVAESPDDSPEVALLRELKKIGNQYVLHPLNRRYQDLPLKKQRIWGRVIRLRKDL
jgi:SOS-response transcriptional repressor LexA